MPESVAEASGSSACARSSSAPPLEDSARDPLLLVREDDEDLVRLDDDFESFDDDFDSFEDFFEDLLLGLDLIAGSLLRREDFDFVCQVACKSLQDPPKCPAREIFGLAKTCHPEKNWKNLSSLSKISNY